MLRWDIALQIRSHYYTATLLATAVICGLIMLAPRALPDRLSVLLIVIEPAFLGLVFTGAFILMEKGAGTLSALMVTPLDGKTYLASKVLAFSLLGVLCGLLIALSATRGHFNALIMAIALVLSNAVGVLTGFALVARARSVNAFLASTLIVSVFVLLPLVCFFELVPAAVGAPLRLIPSFAMLVLFEGAMIDAPSVTSLALAAAYLGVTAALGWVFCLHEYDRQLGLSELRRV